MKAEHTRGYTRMAAALLSMLWCVCLEILHGLLRLVARRAGEAAGFCRSRLHALWRSCRANRLLAAACLLIVCGPPAALFYVTAVVPAMKFAGSDTEQHAVDADKSGARKRTPVTDPEPDFLRSLLALSATDSVCLALDLDARSARLMIRGVTVRQCPVVTAQGVRRLRRWRRLHGADSLFCGPFTMERSWATIEKFPVKVKTAPRDTAAASLLSDEPAFSESAMVDIRMWFDRGVVLEVRQVGAGGPGALMPRCAMAGADLACRCGGILCSLVRLKVPNPELRLRIEVDRSDAVAIYRSLPVKGNMALRL